MLNKEIKIPALKVWHLLLAGIVAFLIWTNYVQKMTVTKLQDDNKVLVEKNKENDDKIKAFEKVIKGYDLQIAKKDTLIKKSEQKEKYWRWSYNQLKKQAQNENTNPIHSTSNDRANYLITKYGSSK